MNGADKKFVQGVLAIIGDDSSGSGYAITRLVGIINGLEEDLDAMTERARINGQKAMELQDQIDDMKMTMREEREEREEIDD